MTTAAQRKRQEKKRRRAASAAEASVHDCTLIEVVCETCGTRQRNQKADEGFMVRKCVKGACRGYTGVFA